MAIELRSYVNGNWCNGVRAIENVKAAKLAEVVAQVSMGVRRSQLNEKRFQKT